MDGWMENKKNNNNKKSKNKINLLSLLHLTFYFIINVCYNSNRPITPFLNISSFLFFIFIFRKGGPKVQNNNFKTRVTLKYIPIVYIEMKRKVCNNWG